MSTLLHEWEKERQQGKQIKRKSFEKYFLFILRIVLAVFFTLVIPLIPLVIFLHLLGLGIEKLLIMFHLNPIFNAIRTMKVREERNKFQAMRDVYYHYDPIAFDLADMHGSEEQKKAFELLFKDLIAILKNQVLSPKKANRLFIQAYRKLLWHPIYRLNKKNEGCRLIALLHDFAVAIPNRPSMMGEYQQLGRVIIAASEIDYGIQSSDIEGKALADKLRHSHRVTSRHHYCNEGVLSRILYGIMHPRQLLGTFSSEAGLLRRIAELLGVYEYDSHGTLSNNPSLQGRSVWRGEKICGEVNHCYGGSPTIGDHRITPEYKALLQAIENRSINARQSYPFEVPFKALYHSLQNIDKKSGEAPRSRALMLLNEVYPKAFIGTILSKDSCYSYIKHAEDVVWESAASFSQILKGKLMEGVHFPENIDHGYYFHGSAERWESLFDGILNVLNRQPVFQEVAVSLDAREKLQNAYVEFVYALLVAVVECQTIQQLNQENWAKPLLMEMIVCRENIDRGGMENLKNLYVRFPLVAENQELLSDKEKLEYLVGAMHGRALSARDRVILKVRTKPVLAFIEKVKPQQFKEALDAVLKDLGLDAQLTYSI